MDALTSAYIVGAALLICNAELDLFWLAVGPDRPQAGDLGRHMLLAAITYYPLYLWLGTVTQPGNINYPIAIFLVCYVGMVYGPVAASLIRRAGDSRYPVKLVNGGFRDGARRRDWRTGSAEWIVPAGWRGTIPCFDHY